MRAPKTRRDELWVVYRMTIKGLADGANAVCSQTEWAAMELAAPGRHTLVRSKITNEAEAERLARGTSGDPVPRTARRAVAPAAVAEK